MPMGKYYCDYCDKEFQDTPLARKRHLQSSSHFRAKSLWYNSFPTSSSAAVAPPSGVCNRFRNTGFCPYGDSCKYLHLNNDDAAAASPHNSHSPTVTRGQGLVAGDGIAPPLAVGGRSSFAVPNSMGAWWGNLPPSLLPPPEGGYPPLPFVDWG
ncbi:unnamed protein product [Linum trigynum]|uniref:C3H1-type domain-containing protein n=1 Tax=Linum trigynum TaxID=586398 RepID=A0AAV2GAN3_9ROSI